jgi:hypothetical protein
MNTIDDTVWKILGPVDLEKFDFSWTPPVSDTPYIYVWGNKWYDCSTDPMIEYHQPDARSRVYMKDPVELLESDDRWHTLIPGASVDKTWHPHPYDPPYIHVFGNKWNDSATEPTVEYRVPGATDRKYVDNITAELQPTTEYWHALIPGASIDQTWRPNPFEPPFIYVFGNKWNDATTEPTVEYRVPGATDRKYVTDVVATLEQTPQYWRVPNPADLATFDFSWRPNPYAPPHIYQWENNGPIYTIPGATEVILVAREQDHGRDLARYYITTTLEDLIAEHSTEVFWALNRDLNYDRFDFKWKPTEENFLHINSFGNELSKDSNTYYINGPAYILGHRDINYVEDAAITFTTDIDMFYISRNNYDTRFAELKARFPKLQKTRYLNSWVETINRCIRKATTKFVWILSSECDYSEFEFDFYPSSWQQNLIHVFGNQWTHWDNTYLINTETFEQDTAHIKIIEHLSNINHVRSRRTKRVDCLYDILYIDHGNPSSALDQLRNRCPDSEITVVPFQQSYANVIVEWTKSLNEYEVRSEHYVWICSSVCDYSTFDFTWTYDPFQNKQLHAFASRFGDFIQKFGDTFLLNLGDFKSSSYNLENLEDYTGAVNYINYVTAPRLQHPVIEHLYDSQTDAIKALQPTDWPYVELINTASAPEEQIGTVPMLWDESHRSILITATGASRIIVPTVAVDFIGKEVYDYHDVKFVHNRSPSQPLDIVFFSNGETIADENYQHLENIIKTRNLPNRLVRIDRVEGRVASQHAAARASNTAWYFLVNAKLKVNDDFDFSWQPDRLQQPKHYIFTALNPVNGLEYGHQAIVANNKQLTLDTEVQGLDFTMASLHQVINKNSGVALYNTDPWTTWRTAFREVIKLKYDADRTGAPSTITRLEAWLSIGDGDFGDQSIAGAQAAVEYYDSVIGDLDELMNTYDWEWIHGYYETIMKR